MSVQRRATVTALLATISACAFLVAMVLLLPNFASAVRGEPTHDNVTFTFQSFECNTESFAGETCRWFGTISEGGAVVETGVLYASEPPVNVAAGVSVPALWSFHNPFVAWDIDSMRSWLGTIATTIVTAICLVALVWASVAMWRRVRRLDQPSTQRPRASDHQELTGSSA